MYFASFLLVVLLNNKDAIGFVETDLESSNCDWDILIFTQHWPSSICYQWEKKQKKNKCSLPSLSNIWTVHGIWPTKLNKKGPEFCNKTIHFDPDLLNPIEEQLTLYWTNIEKNTPLHAFWKHEWQKHGSCAVTLPSLDNELKYFQQALTWIGQYHMQTVLSMADIKPNMTQEYKVEEIHKAITSVLGKTPTIECIADAKTKAHYVSEIRICFNKSLDLTDCADRAGVVTNCPLKKPVLYPSRVPAVVQREEYDYERVPLLLNVYRFVQFLVWFTL